MSPGPFSADQSGPARYNGSVGASNPAAGAGTTTDKKAATVKKSTAPSTAKRRRPKVARSKANHAAAIAATLKGLDNSKPKTAKAAAALELLRSGSRMSQAMMSKPGPS